MQEEILTLLDRNLQAIWDGDADAFAALCAPDVSFFEWYISTQRIDGVDFPPARDPGACPGAGRRR